MMKYPYPRDVKEALMQLTDHFELERIGAENSVDACKAVQHLPTAKLNQKWRKFGDTLNLTWLLYSQESKTMIMKQWQDALEGNVEAVKVIDKWMSGKTRKEEIAAQKARDEEAKNEESPPQPIVADFHTALKRYITPHYELVEGLGGLTMKQIGQPSNLPQISEGCFGGLPSPYEPAVLKAMKKLQKKHELFQRRAERMLINMTELTRAKRAGECDRGDELGYDEDEAEEVMRYFGGPRPDCNDEDEADYLWDLTTNLLRCGVS